MKNQKILLILSVVISYFPLSVLADFNSESEFFYQTVDPEEGGLDVDSDTFGMLYTSYLKTVPTANHPHDEAAFLERIPQFSVGGSFVQGDISTLDVDGFSGLASYIYRDSQSPIIVGVGAGITSVEGDENIFGASVGLENDVTVLNFRVGFYVNNSTVVGLIYENITTEIGVDVSDPGFGSESSDFEIEIATTGLGFKTVNAQGNGAHASFEFDILQYDLDFSSEFVERDGSGNIIFSDSDSGDADGDGFRFGANFYPNQTANLSVQLITADIEDSDSTTLKFGFKSTPANSLGIGFTYETVDSDDGGLGETDTIRVFVTMRK